MNPIQISKGNTKTGRIPAFSLPPIKSCPNNKFCAKQCYAVKSYRMYPSVKTAWNNNFEIAQRGSLVDEFMQWYESKRKKPKYFRIHVSGDFYNEDYFMKWIDIAKRCPDTKFLAFTKVHKLASIPRSGNFELVCSMFKGMDDSGIPHDAAIAYAGKEEDYNNMREFIECPGNCETCGVCWSLSKKNISVRFHIH